MYYFVAFYYLGIPILIIYPDRIEESKIEETKEYTPLTDDISQY